MSLRTTPIRILTPDGNFLFLEIDVVNADSNRNELSFIIRLHPFGSTSSSKEPTPMQIGNKKNEEDIK